MSLASYCSMRSIHLRINVLNMRFGTPSALLLLCSLAVSANTKRPGQPIIIDTDLFGDVDDVGALTIANILHNCGLADLKGIAISTHLHSMVHQQPACVSFQVSP